MEFNGINFDTYFNNYPDKNGYFGKYGGVYIDDKLKAAMAEITEAYYSICQSRKFIAELRRIRKEFQGRPTPVTHLERLSDALGGKVQLYAKREDLIIRALTSLITVWVRLFLQNIWARKRSLPKRVQVSTVLLLLRLLLTSVLNVISIWVLSISKNKLPTLPV